MVSGAPRQNRHTTCEFPLIIKKSWLFTIDCEDLQGKSKPGIRHWALGVREESLLINQ